IESLIGVLDVFRSRYERKCGLSGMEDGSAQVAIIEGLVAQAHFLLAPGYEGETGDDDEDHEGNEAKRDPPQRLGGKSSIRLAIHKKSRRRKITAARMRSPTVQATDCNPARAT